MKRIRSIVVLNTVLIVVFTCALLAMNAWSTYNNNLKVKLQVVNDEVIKLKKEIKMLKADNQAKDKEINKLESQPK